MKKAVLKKEKELAIRNKHHWIFSGAIKSIDKFENGEILQVYSQSNELLGHAYFHNDTSITGRMLNFSNENPEISIQKNIRSAVLLRHRIFRGDTNCYRVINSEGDYLPGLTVDRYNDTLVIQVSTKGIEKLKPLIIKTLLDEFRKSKVQINCIYEKSTMPARKPEGLEPFKGLLFGELASEILVKENGIKFIVQIEESQKTGLFLDMREMRELVGELASKKRILNCFAYTGGFSLYSAKNDAKSVDSLDISQDAMNLARRNFIENKLSLRDNRFIATDAFKFLHSDPLDYNFVILDPPAFAKKKEDVINAKKGYFEINRSAMKKMPRESFLLTCSCSYHVNREMFEETVLKAAKDANRSVRILHRQRLAKDHPININHSEIDYLKSLLLYLD
jgi:23S rRNA (cytosine1962-C5)-methyltransferase